MITIIFGPPRVGKTAFMTHVLNERAFDIERNKQMRKEIKCRNNNGFDLVVPVYSVYANYPLVCKKFRYFDRPATIINPYHIGFANENVPTYFLPPFATVGISEAQKYFNSRRFKEFPDWQSRYFEQHGHNFLDFFLDTQRPNLIDVNIRELSCFIEILSLDIKPKKLTWRIRTIENACLYDLYVSSGKKDSSCFTENEVVANYDVFKLYDSRNCKPLFYAGHYNKSKYYSSPCDLTGQTKQDFFEYAKTHIQEVPQNFYKKDK